MHKNIKTTKGGSLIEYGILVGLIAILSIVAVLSLGDRVRTTFNDTSTTLSGNIQLTAAQSENTTTPPIPPAPPTPIDPAAEIAARTGCTTINYGTSTNSFTVNAGGINDCYDVTGAGGFIYGSPGSDMLMSWTNKRNNGSIQFFAANTDSSIMILDLPNPGYSEVNGGPGFDIVRIVGQSVADVEVRAHASFAGHYIITVGTGFTGSGPAFFPSMQFRTDQPGNLVEEFHFDDQVLTRDQVIALVP